MAPTSRFLAVKKLTRSDLTFFKHHYDLARAENPTSSRQKSVNLNRDIFVAEMYPTLLAGNTLAIALRLAGPTHGDEQVLQRKIVRSSSSKNWRLNGEVIPDPEDDPARYHALADGDFAILEFVGDEQPSMVRCLLVTATDTPSAHERIRQFMVVKGAESMALLQSSELRELVDELGDDAGLLQEFVTSTLDEEMVLAGATAVVGKGPAITAGEFEARRAAIARIGLGGEQLYANYLDNEVESGSIESYEWVSLDHAAAPMDFTVLEAGQETELEVKTTTLAYWAPFHLSLAEARRLVQQGDRYRLIRIYDLTENAARAREVRGLTQSIAAAMDVIGTLPPGIGVADLMVDLREVEGVMLGDEIALGGPDAGAPVVVGGT